MLPVRWDGGGGWCTDDIIDPAGSVPGYRFNKFQPLMPAWVEREVLGEYLLDVGTAGSG